MLNAVQRSRTPIAVGCVAKSIPVPTDGQPLPMLWTMLWSMLRVRTTGRRTESAAGPRGPAATGLAPFASCAPPHKPLLGVHPLFDRTVVLFDDVVQMLHWPVAAASSDDAGPLQCRDG